MIKSKVTKNAIKHVRIKKKWRFQKKIGKKCETSNK